MDNNVDKNKMLYACTVRVCCRRTHTIPQILEMLDQDQVIKDAVVGVNTISKGRFVDLEVMNFQLYNQLILQGLPCPSHKVIHKVIPVYTEDKCLITAYNTPTKAVALPELTQIIEEHGYEIVMVHQVDIRPGLKSGIRKYLTKFNTSRTPTKMPEMVELYGRKIGFEQTSSASITEPQPEAQKGHQEQQEITIELPQETNADTTTETTIETTTELVTETNIEREQQSNMDIQEENLDTSRKALMDERSYANITKTPMETQVTPSTNATAISDDNHHHSIFNMSFLRNPSSTELDTSQTMTSEQRKRTQHTFEYEGFLYNR